MALLRLMADWARDEKVRLFAVTVNHGLRADAAKEAEFVAQTCEALKIKHSTLRWTGWQGDGNLQDAARRARYRLMAEWAASADVSTIALGHTADDQAETFFMRLARTAGIDGLTGMQRRRFADGITWVRPLLMQERFELRQYLRDLRQPWVDDPSNEDDAFDRVKAREAMAALTKLGIDVHVVGRVMDHLGQVRTALDYATHDHALDCVRVEEGDLVIDRAELAASAPEVTRRLLSHALRWIASAEYGPRGMALQEFISAALRGKDATLHGVRLLGGKETLRLTREYAAVAHAAVAEGDVWDGRWVVEGDKNQGLVTRALGEVGLAQLPERAAGQPPRAALAASPALFDGDTLVAAPLAGFGPAKARLVHPKGHFFTTLLSH